MIKEKSGSPTVYEAFGRLVIEEEKIREALRSMHGGEYNEDEFDWDYDEEYDEEFDSGYDREYGEEEHAEHDVDSNDVLSGYGCDYGKRIGCFFYIYWFYFFIWGGWFYFFYMV